MDKARMSQATCQGQNRFWPERSSMENLFLAPLVVVGQAGAQAPQPSLLGGDVATHASGAPQGLMEKKAFFACKWAKGRKHEKATEATIVP